MLLPGTFKNDGSYRTLMIPFCKMTTSNIMLENAWMNYNVQYGPNILILMI